MPCNKYSCECDDSSTCKYKKYKPKCKAKKDNCWNPYINSTPCGPCGPCPPYGSCPPYPCPTPYSNQCGPYSNPCNPCNPCYQPSCAPCNQPKTYNPFMYPNYTIYNSSTNFSIPSQSSAGYYIYSVNPASSTPVTITLPLISSLDNCKKRNFVIANSGSASIYVNAYNSTDTINGSNGSPASITLSPGESVQFYSDGNYNNWIVINGVPPSA